MAASPVRLPRGVKHERLDATIRGRVQGVGYRFFVIRHALDLGLTGWVANERDGSVRCVAEGDRPALDALLARLERGPAGSIVERVTAARGPATGEFAAFDVRGSGHSGD